MLPLYQYYITKFKIMIKKLLILMFFLGGIGLASAQPWLKNLPDIGTSKNYSLYEYKTAFDKYWAPYDVKHGSYFENGKKMKAIGWKQFQRWYYSMENQVDRSTGHLPVISALDVMANYRKLKSAQAIQADWKSLGPDITAGGYAGLGRINCIAFHPTDMNTYWVGAASGGLWVTRDNGVTWTCQTDNNGVLAVSNIIIPSNFSTSNTVYISTGDRDGWDNRSIGVLKSTDGGQTWNKTGLSYTLQDGAMVNRLIVNPTDENTLIAATSLGVFKTTDGGTTWSTKLANNNFIDFEFKPGDFSTFYGSTQNGTIYVSRDGGTTWNEIFNESDGSRIEMAVTAHDATYLYALVSDGSGGFYKMLKSTDAGANFTAVLDFNEINLLGWEGDGTDAGGQGWYDLALEASPTNKNIVLVGGVNSWRTLDGGTTWEILTHWYGQNGVQAVHADKHAIEYRSNGDVFECNDGGVYLSTSDGANYESKCSGLVISQMYKLGVSATDPDEIIAGLQDNGTKLKSGSAWYDVKGGDGMECIIDFTDNNIQYGTYTNGQISRTLDHWQSETEIQPADAGDGAWVTPYIMSPDDNATLYAGYADIWKTTDRGDSWTKITDLSSSYRFRSMAISLSNTKVLYVADLSNIYRTTDDGANWINITNNLPTGSNSITYIAIKHDDENTAWVTLGGYNDDKVYETTDGGATWTNISAGLPEIPAYSIVQNKQVTGEVHLYVGTEVGVYFKKGSSDWVMYSDGLPNVRIGELEIFYSSNAESSMLRAASYGRGMWESNVYYESGPMEFSAVTVKHPNTNAIAPGATDEDILLVQVAMTGSENPLSITSLVFNTQGTTDVSDITLASLYTTGTSLNADNAVLLGTIANPNGAMEFTVDRELAGGTNNFWLLYNIAQEATLNNVVDAECLSVTVGGTVRNPDIMAPDGNREINIIYCEAGASDEYEFISNVALGDIGNVSNFSTNGYGDYTAMSTDLTIGETYECIVDVSNAYASDELLAWVDWNKDGDFDDEGEQVLSSGAVGLSNYTFNIVVPSDAKLGNTRLRLRLNDTGSTPNSLPCGNSGYGEVEDYTINVTQNIFDPINGLVAYYPFNGNANDESGNGNNGTVQAAALANDRHGNSNAAYYFNGIDNYIEILNSGNLLNNTNFSLSAWIKPDNLLYSFNPIITKHQLDDNSWLFRANPEGAEIHLGFETFQPTLRYSDNVNLPNGAWRHVAIVKNGENYTFFVNGAPTSTFTDAKEFSTNANIMIGGQANFAEFFKGAIDEVRMYNIPLTSSEIQNIYNSEKPASNLVAYFPFNGNTNDESGNEHNGAINGNVVLTTDWNGAENTAYDFSGEIGSYITVGTGLNLINGDKHSTICAAINFREDEPYQNTIVAERFGEGENYQFAIIARSLYFTFWENNIEKSYHSNQATLLPNRWYHVCNTYNGAEVKHYMDGVIVGTHVATGNIDNHNANLLIGDIFNDSAQEFNGKIDDVRIYDAAMSDAEILDLYNNLNLPNGQETDRQALIALYNATNGANWNNNTNWNTAEPLNTWYGVTTNAEGRVITLELSENNLTGTIPTELGNLSQLSSLNLGTNFLSGSIPTSIGNLSQLVSISVYNNQLTGTIPAEFGNLTLLTGLGLNYNQLSGSIPAALANLTNLTALDLSANQLTGNIPADLGQLTNLLGLSLSGNQLTGNIPPELGNLVKVEEISLNVNQLNGTIPVEFGNLTSLARLYLHSNQLSGSIPQEVANLSNLVQFNFENNYIENIPVLASSVLLANESEGLNTASNYLTFASLEPNAANLQFTSKYAPQRQLPVSQSIVNAVLGQNLNLDFEAIVGRDLGGENNRYQWYKDGTAIGAQSTSPIYSIASVTDTDAGFYRCDITNTVLTGLTLITNDFELQIISGNPSELDSLALVDLYNATNGSSWTNNTNWLSGTLDTWYGIKLDANRRVESLILNENNLVGTIPASLGNLTSLKLLNLEKNSLSGTIPSTIGNLVNLTKLVFWSNNLSGSIPSELGSLANLHYLDMDENPFNQQLPDAIFNLTLLDTIYLGSCGFTGNIPSTISNLNSLKLLSFYNNSLTGSIPAELGNLTNLQKLYLGSNQLSGSIPAELGNLTNLQYLSLSGNQLSGSIPAELSNLTNLQTLVLSYNQLSGSIPAEIGNLIGWKFD